MSTMEVGYQHYLQSLERSLKIIRYNDKLSLEASIEELCKVQLLKWCCERCGVRTLRLFTDELIQNSEKWNGLFYELFMQYVPANAFKGWEYPMLSMNSFVKVVEELSNVNLFGSDVKDEIAAFSDFLRNHFSGYLSEYSSPQILCKFITTALDMDRVESFADPCCGLGGLLMEADKQKRGRIKLKGFDINRRMANIANMQMMMRGYSENVVECQDILETAIAFMDGPFEAVASHLPLRHRAFSVNQKRFDNIDRMFSRIQEDIIIDQILKMLKPNGMAALVVSDELLMSESRKDSRIWLYKNAHILNITRFEGLSYSGGNNMRSYNVMFLKKTEDPVTDVCLATLINSETNESDIIQMASSLRGVLYGDGSDQIKDSKYFRLLQEEVWNVDLFLSRVKMGSKYPTCQLKDIVVHDRQMVKVEDDRNYKQLTVRSKGLGVVARKEEHVKTQLSSKNTRYKARNGQIIISSLEADKGAIGVVTKELNGALVSNNYYLFSIISPLVDPDYLALVLSSKPVLKQLEHYKRGRVMPRIPIEKIMSLVIPLPDLDEQKRMVANLKRKVKRANQIQDELESEQREFSVKLFGEE